jgi:hypothetical protein
MTKRRIPWCVPVLLASLSAACGGDGDDGEGTAGTGGQTPTAMAGGASGGNGGSGGNSGGAGGGSANGGTDSGGAGATQTGAGTGGGPAGGATDQLVHDTSDTCNYSAVRIEIDEGGDAAVEASIDSWMKTAMYDRSSGTKFIVDTHDDEHLELSWQPPASKPGIVDFRGVFKYTAQDGNRRSLCFDGRMIDAFHYPIELYYPFVATSVFEVTSDGECTATAVSATVSGCVSDGYNIR